MNWIDCGDELPPKEGVYMCRNIDILFNQYQRFFAHYNGLNWVRLNSDCVIFPTH